MHTSIIIETWLLINQIPINQWCPCPWWGSSCGNNYDFKILSESIFGPNFYKALRLLKVSPVTSPKTMFFRSMKGHGAKVIANLLLLVFYSLMLVRSPGRSWYNSKDSSLNLGPKIEQFPPSKLPIWIKLLCTNLLIWVFRRLSDLVWYFADPRSSCL